ncbi:MAG: HK97 gp10 family phage protein [Clostridiales bacterium]|nr:HK97 gp10 family phage protein [Clostridiales bacterium]
MGVSVSGFDALISALEQSPDKLQRATVKRVATLAEKVATQAREGAPVNYGQLRNSLESYVEAHGDQIEGGVKTSYAAAVYQEFGTGPVGAANPHPKAAELDVTYEPDGWTYYSESAVGKPLPDTIKFGKHKGEQRKPPGQVSNGLVYTEGVPAKAFMYNALTSNEDAILEGLGGAIEEVFLK